MSIPTGIFILAELTGESRARVREIQQKFDPKLSRRTPPHLTLAGSSGVGPVASDTTVEELRARLDPIAATTAPLVLEFGRPHRFMQTDIVSLPLDPHGPLRELHERIARSGLRFLPARFQFSPHVTLSFYPTLTLHREKELLSLRVTTPCLLDRLQLFLTCDPQPSVKLLELELRGSGVGGGAELQVGRDGLLEGKQ